MSKLGLIMAMTGIMAATSEYGGHGISMKQKSPEPEWKRKKCKSCRNCGANCNPYNYKGHILTRFSKPTHNACEKWSKK